MMPYIVLGVALVAVLVGFYNRLVLHGNRMREGWSGIDVQLKRRHNLIPSLVECVKGYAQHERAALERVTALREQALGPKAAPDAQAAEQALSDSLRPLLLLAEAYPDLKAASVFADLQRQLVEVEDHLQMARRYYNGCVRNYNNLVEAVPGVWIAPLFAAKPAAFFEIESATERSVPTVNLGPENA